MHALHPAKTTTGIAVSQSSIQSITSYMNTSLVYKVWLGYSGASTSIIAEEVGVTWIREYRLLVLLQLKRS